MRKRFRYLLLILLLAFSLTGIASPGLTNGGNPTPVSGCDTVLPGPPSIRSVSVTNTDLTKGEILINFNTAPDKYIEGYIIFRSVNNGSFVEIDTLVYTSKGIYQFFNNALNTTDNIYSYYFRSFDSCGNISTPSDTHTIAHLVASPADGRNILSWNDYTGFQATTYFIYKRTGIAPWRKIAAVNGSINSYTDSNVNCNIIYSYQLIAYNTSTGKDSAYSNSDTARSYKTTPPVAPIIINTTVTVSSDNLGQIQINWNPSVTANVKQYIIYRRQDGSPWEHIVSLPSSEYTYTDVSLNTHSWEYYYKILAIDSCGNVSNDLDKYHRTVHLGAAAGNQVIGLNWNTYWGFPVNQYNLYRNGKLIRTFDSTINSYTDSAINCPNAYNYVIHAVGKDTSSWSNRDSAVPTDTTAPLPPVIRTASVKIPNQIMSISWQPSLSSDAMGYKIYSTGDEGQTHLLYQNNGPDSIYDDTIAQGNAPGCYFLVAYDHCGNTSGLSNPGCIINLSGNATSLENNLAWNEYKLWKDSVDHYVVYRNIDNDGWVSIAQTGAEVVNYIDKDLSSHAKSFCYRVEAVETTGKANATSWSTEICLSQPPIIYFPSAFTPNYSFNLNDYFGPKGAYFSNYVMKIFDRWGEMIYETNSGQPWDGKYKGGYALIGLYQYQIEIEGYNGNTYQYKGTVEITN